MAKSSPKKLLHWETAKESFPFGLFFGAVIAVLLSAAAFISATTSDQRLFLLRLLFWVSVFVIFGLIFEWQRQYNKRIASAGLPHKLSFVRLLGIYAACSAIVFIGSLIIFRPQGANPQTVALTYSPPTAVAIRQQIMPHKPPHREPSVFAVSPKPSPLMGDFETHVATPVALYVPPTRLRSKRSPIPMLTPPWETPRPTPSPSAGSGNVTSNNQSGGVTARDIGTVTQNVAPDRTKYLKPIQQFYAQGVAIRQGLLNQDLTDTQIEKAYSDTTTWANLTARWLLNNLGLAAEARFADLSNIPPMSYSLTGGGEHKADELQKRNNMLNSLGVWLDNLRALMESGAYDSPQSAASP